MSYRGKVLATVGLVSYHRLGDAGSTALDEVGLYPGTYTGTAPAESLLGVDPNPARSFDGALDEVLIAYNAAFNTAHLTVESWFRLDAWEVDAAIVNRRTTGGTMGWSFQISGSGSLRFDCFIGGGFRSVDTSGWVLGTTYYAVCTYDGTTLRVYRGTATSPVAEIGSTAFTGSINGPVNAQIKIGRTVTIVDTITGVIDEVAIYNTAISTVAISEHHIAGLTEAPIALPTIGHGRIPGSFGVETALYRADRYGNRLERVPIRIPVSGSIDYNEDNEIKRRLSLAVNDPHSFRPFHDFVIPEITVVTPDGIATTRPFGHYLVTPPRTSLTPGRLSGSIEAKDITYLAARSSVGALTITAGTDTGAAARDILLGAGYAAIQLDIPDTGVPLAADLFPDPGTARLKQATDLLNTANWYAPWMNGAGRITTRPYADLQATAPHRTYSTESGLELIPPIDSDPDWSRLCNSVTVRNIGPGRDPIWATARITNPAHPLFYDPFHPDESRFPYELSPPPIDDPQIATVEQAMARAQSLLAEGASYYLPLRIRSVIDLDADAHDVIGLDVRHGNQPLYGGNWFGRTWTVNLRNVTATIDRSVYHSEAWQ